MTREIHVQTRGMPWTPDLPEAVRERLAAWMRYAQDSEQLTREELARRVGLSEPTVTNIINHKRPPGLDALIGLCFGVGIPADILLKRHPDEQRTPQGDTAGPASASPSSARPGRRRAGGR